MHKKMIRFKTKIEFPAKNERSTIKMYYNRRLK